MAHRYIVEVIWNDRNANRELVQNQTLHGPFDSEEDAEAWAANEIGDDPSADTYYVLLLNAPNIVQHTQFRAADAKEVVDA